MRTIRIRRQLNNDKQTPAPNYQMTLEVTTAEDIDPNIFVKQQSATTITFAAIATPTQMEELTTSVTANTTYFRDKTITIIGTNEQYLADIFTTILQEVKMLITNLNALDTIKDETDYIITEDSVQTI